MIMWRGVKDRRSFRSCYANPSGVQSFDRLYPFHRIDLLGQHVQGRRDAQQERDVVTADDPERDDIPVVPLAAPFGLDDAVAETAEHLLRVRAVHTVDLDALRGDETEHLVPVDRVAAFRQFIFDACQVLVDH